MLPNRVRGGRGRRLLALALAAALCSAAWAEPIKVPELLAPGSVAVGAEGIPLIKAQNEHDLAFLQGYAHARDRFFQMDYSRRGASGTIAELLGQPALANDVQTRTLGLRRAAWATWQAASADTRAWLKAYADGVNYWLRSTPSLPPEYQALEISQVEPWSPVDSIVIGKALAFQLSFDLDIQATLEVGGYQQAGQAGGFDGAALYFGDTHRFAPPDNRVTIPPASGAALSASELKAQAEAARLPAIDATTLELARAYRDKIADHPLISPHLKRREDRAGSNEWVVDGSMTVSGKPILANDPHLSLALPSVFVEQHLSSTSPAINVTGVTVAGAPGVIQGCNDRLCWGTTTNPLDVTDVFQETLVLNSYGLPYATRHGTVEEPVEWVFQNFYVNKTGDGVANNLSRDNSIGYTNGAVTVLVPRRNRGPIVQISGSSGLSVAYTGWGATSELESFRRINRAQNLAEFQDALTYFDVGSQNFAYADVDGNIAYFTSAEAPLRTDLQTQNAPGGGRPPWLVRDGSGALKHDWLPLQNRQPNQAVPFEVLPVSEMPQVINPAAGYFANANNDPVGTTLDNNPLNQLRPGGGLYYLNFNYSAYRQGRIARTLEGYKATGQKLTVADMQKLQANNRLMDAALVSPHLTNALGRAKAAGAWAPLAALAADAQVNEAVARIGAWDFSTPTGVPEGYDPGDNPAALAAPSQAEIDNSVAASLFAIWRSYAIRNTVDATLTKVGLGSALPDSSDGYASLKFLLDNFGQLRGKGLSGVNFFALPAAVGAAPTPEDARDYLLLKSMKDGLDRFASSEFAPAFSGSTNQADYRWGKLHRIVFAHPLSGPFSLPGANPYGFVNYSAALPGVPRSGGFDAVDASSHNARANTVNGFMYSSGPARRFVGEMLPTIAATEIIPGGQSAVLGSPLYASQLGRWLTNNYHALPVNLAAATAASPTVTEFAP
ncbi:penicillin acylase family protein [Tahibacter harae]|uniref:Penicillin acylase family protein n=1 Tax=Tahibacter harae TaxID=2963937 RepID=A0ABT1QSQ9_9GAMM|nr:penicillin acylase family protein [Tahibacter harae]MCQ4165325.1 penicillin acylase family protein [Tahibacter harae]